MMFIHMITVLAVFYPTVALVPKFVEIPRTMISKLKWILVVYQMIQRIDAPKEKILFV